ncbi:MAG: HAD family phosphatase [Actinomycetota bacterium]
MRDDRGVPGQRVDEFGIRALVVDWGGVLTGSVDTVWAAWAEQDAVDREHLRAALRGPAGDHPGPERAGASLVHALERGELSGPQFEQLVAQELARRGSPVQPHGLLERMLGGLTPSASMLGVVARVKAAGLRTAVLSNSWANEYPREGWDELFDAVVISGEVGMRKPEPRIYQLLLDRLALPAGACVFVDDLAVNVAAAVEVGMVGVLHRSVEQTAAELEVLLGLTLRQPGESA